jgi:hypothetical protein
LIIRNSVACKTCGYIHTVRVYLGVNPTQIHNFNCLGCNEEISISLDLDLQNISAEFNFLENSEPAEQEGSVINLDPAFPINKDLLNVDGFSTRIRQVHALAERQRELLGHSVSMPLEKARNILEYDIKEEWKNLKKCWSLSKNGRDKLAKREIEEANEKYYRTDPLDSYKDWLFRFCFKLSGKAYYKKFERIAKQLNLAAKSHEKFKKFHNYFNSELFTHHQDKYFDILKDYFIAYDTFNQIHIYTHTDLEIPSNSTLSLFEFDKVKMFYGNCYEIITSSFETFACLNNIIAGREFDTFETITLKKYKTFDKSSRHNPFSSNSDFSCICDCLNNNLRNASHHASFVNDSLNHTIKYRSGKGGTGSEETIKYLDYILLCENIVCSIAVIMQIELMLNSNYTSSTQ